MAPKSRKKSTKLDQINSIFKSHKNCKKRAGQNQFKFTPSEKNTKSPKNLNPKFLYKRFLVDTNFNTQQRSKIQSGAEKVTCLPT
jgi:hypothetical protein